MEAICMGRGSGSLRRRRGFGIGHELALILLQSEPRSGHDRATIAPQSGVDRDVNAPFIAVE